MKAQIRCECCVKSNIQNFLHWMEREKCPFCTIIYRKNRHIRTPRSIRAHFTGNSQCLVHNLSLQIITIVIEIVYREKFMLTKSSPFLSWHITTPFPICRPVFVEYKRQLSRQTGKSYMRIFNLISFQ